MSVHRVDKPLVSTLAKIFFPLLLAGAILYWMYHDFDFEAVSDVLRHEMNWTWMILSFPFGIMAQVFRGWRWRQTLAPLDEYPRRSVAVLSIFVSYALSLVIPRSGEFARCAVLKRYDRVSFSKALGTVVTERAIDSLLVLVVTGVTLLFSLRTFGIFFEKTGTSLDAILHSFTPTGYFVTAVCGVAALILVYLLIRQLEIYQKVKETISDIWRGILSVGGVSNVPLFVFYTVGIWGCYFLHYYLTFFCFDFTSELGIGCAMVTFVVGSIAVIVPTPNGAGPWHFAVKTMLILYGVKDINALYFVLIVHTIQTFLVIALGIYAYIRLAFIKRA